MINVSIQPGDRVHARLYNVDRSDVAIQEFIVTEILDTTYFGGPIPCNTGDGWELELVYKSLENLSLPESLSEITAYRLDGSSAHLMGKGTVWVTSTGEPFDVHLIIGWEPGHI